MHKIIWFQVFLSNTNNFPTYLFDPLIKQICKIGTTTLGQGGPWSDFNKGMTPHSSKLEPHYLMQFLYHIQNTKLQHHRNLTLRLFSVIYRTLIGRGSYPSAEVQLMYSTAPGDWTTAIPDLCFISGYNIFKLLKSYFWKTFWFYNSCHIYKKSL